MNTTFQKALTTLEQTLTTLLTSLTTPTASTAPTAALNLLTADDHLTTALTTLRQHQANHLLIQHLRTEATTLETQVHQTLKQTERLEKAARSHSPDTSDSETETREVDYRTLVDFARRISRYNQAAAEEAGGVDEATRDATAWLDESAVLARGVYLMGYPVEERIRRGVMGGDWEGLVFEGGTVDVDVAGEGRAGRGFVAGEGRAKGTLDLDLDDEDEEGV
ncbi:vitamin-D-receptor interacting mediator subunit 4-domain-containing protein [Aspergillus coremiiformis]|uniref:Mediator of RNA polymerase II transcription subunit 4 n=1 Tax=Aspergillus coremiiformis TaxID=138285 RepID=A0A5N6Z8M6_9EURO|nr:vitamin-D-receptor interacting mediator subunit 4-domain-containing protein [Aspergillus coremiiformis]